MRLAAAFAAFAIISCGPDRLTPWSECGQPCYSGPAGTAAVGACTRGVTVCEADGGRTCSGEVLPSPEVCDGVDNDCNGSVDDNIQQVSCYSGPAGTEWVGLCQEGTSACVNGATVCNGEVVPTTEQCDGLDHNCNGIIGDIPPNPCYDGPAGSVTNPGCHYGYTACQMYTTAYANTAYKTVCLGEATPHQVPLTLMFGLATNQTMGSYGPEFTTEVGAWCQRNDAGCGLVTSCDTNIDNTGDAGCPRAPTVVQQPTLNSAAFNAAANAVMYGPNGGSGDVGTMDLLYDVADVYQTDKGNQVGINWQPNTLKILFFVTDEEGQTLSYPTSKMPIDVQKLEQQNGVVIVIWTHYVLMGDYSGMTDVNGGTLNMLENATPATIRASLDALLKIQVCY